MDMDRRWRIGVGGFRDVLSQGSRVAICYILEKKRPIFLYICNHLTSKAMGKIHTKLVVINNIDEILCEGNLIAKDKIRSLAIEDVLIDTGATTLALPTKIINFLGLKFMKTVAVSTASGISERKIYQNVKVKDKRQI